MNRMGRIVLAGLLLLAGTGPLPGALQAQEDAFNIELGVAYRDFRLEIERRNDLPPFREQATFTAFAPRPQVHLALATREHLTASGENGWQVLLELEPFRLGRQQTSHGPADLGTRAEGTYGFLALPLFHKSGPFKFGVAPGLDFLEVSGQARFHAEGADPSPATAKTAFSRHQTLDDFLGSPFRVILFFVEIQELFGGFLRVTALGSRIEDWSESRNTATIYRITSTNAVYAWAF